MLLCNLALFGQDICIVDSLSNKPILNVLVVNDKAQLLGTTDTRGMVTLPAHLSHSAIELTHVSYLDKQVHIFGSSKTDTIRLQPQVWEVTTRNEKQVKSSYTVLHAYFRSYQFDGDDLRFYCDGLVDYFVPNNNKRPFKIRTGDYRLLQHKDNRLYSKENKLDFNFFWGGPQVFTHYRRYHDKMLGVVKQIVGNKLITDRHIIPRDTNRTRKFHMMRCRLKETKIRETLNSCTLDNNWRRRDVTTFGCTERLDYKSDKRDTYSISHIYTEVYIISRKYASKREAKRYKVCKFCYWKEYGTNIGLRVPIDFEKYGVPKVPVYIQQKIGHELYNKYP